jgi:hypothetical protein
MPLKLLQNLLVFSREFLALVPFRFDLREGYVAATAF